MKKKILGIIPARGGSKGVIRKNIRSVGGKPLIHWAIDAALKSNLISDFYVTTDDEEIKSVAAAAGAKTILRPAALAEDKTPMIPVLQHLCEKAEDLNGVQYDYVILMQPTAPMRTSDHIDSSIYFLLENSNFDSLVSVYKVDDCHPSRMYTCNDNELIPFYEEPTGALRQDLLPVYHRNGCIYLCERSVLMENDKLIGNKPYAFIMKKSESVNIDDEDDLLMADYLMSRKSNLK
ncbi:hypothetical protein TUM3794_28900 [Shewanella colwelliana]|uniref:Acylneuraminate cytidylyltransferase family protein n=1 Tax=Shewanella colwelliana TaxID=23 RepID=A0ABQ4P781_SHECO|nr:acylneuraminate cytidylyltransferase family protein [Shewanella colwelliana]GIU43387.1 hypothetical protein TUM3794_28900 [Shewanella colwelliana]